MSSVIRATFTFFLLIVFSHSAMAQIAKRGTKDEAVVLVKKVKQMWRTLGPAQTIKAVNKLTHNLRNKDLYPFIGHTDGYVVAHFFQAIRGLKTQSDTDSKGRSIMGDMVKVASTQGRGWTEYDWPNPITKRIDAKQSYVESLNSEYFVAVGVFKRLKDSELAPER